MKILVVEDNIHIAEVLSNFLKENLFSVDTCDSVTDAKALIATFNYDAIVLDMGLPDGDGRDVLQYIKCSCPKHLQPVVLILSARDNLDDIIDGFEKGALDYMVKPYEPLELLTRLRICLKFKREPTIQLISSGNVQFNRVHRRLFVGNKELVLRRRELTIFEKLFTNKGTVIPYETLMEAAFSLEDNIESNALASYTSRLRKLLRDARADITVKSMRHIGYYIEDK